MPARQFVGTAALVATVLLPVFTTHPSARQSILLDATLLTPFAWRPVGPSTAGPDSAADVSRVTTDAAFPYRICSVIGGIGPWCTPVRAAGADAGTGLASGISGSITPDPLDAEIFYTDQLARFDRRTGQATLVHPMLAEQLRSDGIKTAALAFTADGRTLFAGLRSVWQTTTSGQTWSEISPDLAGSSPAGGDEARVSVVGPSSIDSRTIWAGTTNGRVHVTRNAGLTWTRAEPAALPAGTRVSHLEPSRFDVNSAYLTVAMNGGSTRLWRTRDGGSTWQDLTPAIPGTPNVAAVREDPFRRGLLFAATDHSVFFSIDDGEVWQSLRLNLPATPVQDLTIRDADIVIATGGHGVWVLDDFSPLRQLTADISRADAFLFRPAQTWRPRAGLDGTGDTVALSYSTAGTAAGPVTLEIIETVTGEVIRRYSSDETGRQPGDPLLSRESGLHRVFWDLRYTRPESDTSAPPGARILPGTYQVRLTTDARSIRQAVAVRMDPRIRASLADLTAQRTLARALDVRRAEIARTLGTSPPDPARASLLAARDELRRITRAVNAADARPTPALAAAAADALARSAALVTGP